jgi:hypothetical protein
MPDDLLASLARADFLHSSGSRLPLYSPMTGQFRTRIPSQSIAMLPADMVGRYKLNPTNLGLTVLGLYA